MSKADTVEVWDARIVRFVDVIMRPAFYLMIMVCIVFDALGFFLNGAEGVIVVILTTVGALCFLIFYWGWLVVSALRKQIQDVHDILIMAASHQNFDRPASDVPEHQS